MLYNVVTVVFRADCTSFGFIAHFFSNVFSMLQMANKQKITVIINIYKSKLKKNAHYHHFVSYSLPFLLILLYCDKLQRCKTVPH